MPNIDPDTIPLTELPRRLAELTDAAVPSYRTLYNRALDGKLPIVMAGARYHVLRADLPEIAKGLGLPPKAAAVTSKSRRRTADAIAA